MLGNPGATRRLLLIEILQARRGDDHQISIGLVNSQPLGAQIVYGVHDFVPGNAELLTDFLDRASMVAVTGVNSGLQNFLD